MEAAVKQSVPIYTDHDERYHADACGPLISAAEAGTIKVTMISGGHYPGRSLSTGMLPGLKMAGVWDTVVEQKWGLPWHRNEGIELTFLERGRLSFCTDERSFNLESNDVTIVRPWQRHRIGTPNIRPSRLHWLLIDVGVRRPHQAWTWPPWLLLSPSDIAELTIMLRQNEKPLWTANHGLRHVFQDIARCLECDSDGRNISRLTLRLNELFLILLETMRQKDVRLDQTLTTSHRTVELFLKDLQTNPEHLALPWNVEKMAHSCGLGVTQFIHHVKSLVNMTPVHFLIECRIDLAKKILQKRPKASITETAMECGFSSGQYFATVFARQLGVSPREYARSFATVT
jgi:AraC-like DNA-binding protein